jgi:hypothetical protein
MSEPIVFISHLRIKEGQRDAYLRLQREVTPRLEADKPSTLAFLAFLSEGATRVTIVHLFADAESMDLHFEGADERSKVAYEVVVPEGWEIYGKPSRQAHDTMREAAASAGVTLTVDPEYAAGFLRLAPG